MTSTFFYFQPTSMKYEGMRCGSGGGGSNLHLSEKLPSKRPALLGLNKGKNIFYGHPVWKEQTIRIARNIHGTQNRTR